MSGTPFSRADEDFRDEVRTFLDQELTPELRKIGRETTGVFTDWPLAKAWHEILYRKGWVAPSWPKEYGGTGWTIVQQHIFAAEAASASAPRPAVMGLKMVGPVVMRFGREDQKQRYLPRILSGEDFWCQGYSEPQSGSDLASLRTRAVADGDDYIVNGSKIWTTHAQWANRIFCLVRTSPDAKQQAGITFLLIDMDTPGITVTPIITLAGDHEVNQVFFDNVRVPKANCLGEENQGWTVAKHLLEFERGGSQAAAKRVELEHTRALAQEMPGSSGAALSEDPTGRRSLPSWRFPWRRLKVSSKAFCQRSAAAIHRVRRRLSSSSWEASSVRRSRNWACTLSAITLLRISAGRWPVAMQCLSVPSRRLRRRRATSIRAR